MTHTIQDETEARATVVCRQRSYDVPADVARELAELRAQRDLWRSQRNDLYATLQVAIEFAEEARLSVNAITVALRQVDLDAAASVTRGTCISLMDVARAALARCEKGQS